MTSDNTRIYQFKISLKNVTPVIWRRFLIKSNSTLKDLHFVIQILMGWTDYHLNQFTIKKKGYTIPNRIGYISGGGICAHNILLDELGFKKNEKFFYEYDFTAGWKFEMLVESKDGSQNEKFYPICISGSGASPDEECGGPVSYTYLKDYRVDKSEDILINFLKALVDERNSGKLVGDVLDVDQLKEAYHWLHIDEYKIKEINKFLKLYSKGDEHWMEAFEE